MKAFIGCSSYDEIDDIYFDNAKEVSEVLIDKGYDLVFGCRNMGLMGSIYDSFMDSGAEVTAVCTEFYKEDLDLVSCKKVLVPDTVGQLEEFMKSDVLIFLPGGYGTYNELFYMINAYVTKDHNSKIIVMNVNNYFENLKGILSKVKNDKFAKIFDFVHVVDSVEELGSLLEDEKCLSMEKM